MCLDLWLPWKLLITHLSGKSSTIKPSMETTGTPSATSPDLCRKLMRSSAPFSPAVKPTGWAAIVACPSCKQMSTEWSTLQRILPSSRLEPYKPFFVGQCSQQHFFFMESIHVYNLKPMLSLDIYLLSTLCFPVCSFIPCLYDLWNVEHTNASCPPVPHAGVELIAKVCINTAFSGCRMHFSHIAASPYAKWQHWLNKLCLTGGCRVIQH